MKKEIKTKLLLFFVPRLTWLLLQILGRTSRVAIRYHGRSQALQESGRDFIFICWHGKMLLPIFIQRHRGICAMVSEHTDGEMISRTIQRLGYTTVRGSSTRGGAKAFIRLLAIVKSGVVGCILPDGPRGPRHTVKPGVIMLASRSQRPLLPVTFAAQKAIQLKSWDRFTLWRPFSRLGLIYGEPLTVPPDLNEQGIEQWRSIAQTAMDGLEQEADAFF
ncbi:MAG TPA: lysophospholipid acyltransferase family protein [bacterium]|nr:lysophospholipid acyltransferase family protein [bacterium]